MRKLLTFTIIVLSAFYVNAQETPFNRIKLTNGADQIKFDVSGQNRYWFMSKTASDDKAFALYSPEDGGWFTYWKEASGDMIVNKGKVGIGTTTPLGKLDISLGGWGNIPRISFDQSSDHPSMRLYRPTGATNPKTAYPWWIENSSQGRLIFKSGNPAVIGSESVDAKITFMRNGKVGIGTTDPSNSLHINSPDNQLIKLTSTNGNWIDFESTNAPSGSKIWSLGHLGTAGGFGVYQRDGVNQYRFIVNNSGNVGIGTNAPGQKLTVNGNVRFGTSDSNGLTISKSSGTLQDVPGSSGAIAFQGPLHSHVVFDIRGNDIHDGFYVRVPTTLQLSPTADKTALAVKSSGRVGIGTTNPDSKLTVKGTIHSEEVKVDLNIPGPDYVFEEDYDLISLEETKAYISANKHLPEVPSAKEMEANGINLSDMSMTLLKKIEEMTLHQIDLMEEVKALKTENAELKSRFTTIEQLQKEIEELKNR